MKRYTTDELDGEWEFKIVRSEFGAFRKPENFQRLLDEESIAGWQLVEKLDNKRVRLKRTVSKRGNGAMLPRGHDPYRTQFGGGGSTVGVAIGIGMMVLIGVITMFFVGGNDIGVDLSASSPVIMPIIAGVIGAVLVVFVVVQKRSR